MRQNAPERTRTAMAPYVADVSFVGHDVVDSPVSDFRIGGLTFEVGGKNKGQSQVAGVEGAFVVKDDIEYGYGNVIPLWAFGMMY